jgi:uncharacterized lipoprotein YehR (DUF1307 family)
MKKVSFIIVLAAVLTSCTANERAKKYGGTEEVTLNRNEILLTVTWKNDEMWICTKDTVTGISYFREKSKWGIIEGTVIFK